MAQVVLRSRVIRLIGRYQVRQERQDIAVERLGGGLSGPGEHVLFLTVLSDVEIAGIIVSVKLGQEDIPMGM